MPGRDGTGPIAAGSMTGRGLGYCTGVEAVRYGTGQRLGLGLGLACRRGGFERWFGRGFVINDATPKTRKELLLKEKAVLEQRLDAIEKQLEGV